MTLTKTVTCVIIDATNIDWESEISRYDPKLRALGPLFYIIIGSSLGALGKQLKKCKTRIRRCII